MNISRFAKSVVYQITAVLLLAFSVYYQTSMRSTGGLETRYFASNRFLVILAFVLFGTAVYSFRAFSRRYREHRADVLFLFIVGLILLISSIFIIINYGGLEVPFSDIGFTAVNVNTVLLSVLPVPFFIRGVILALTRTDTKPTSLYIARGLCVLVLAVYIASMAMGVTMRMVHYPEDASYSAGDLEDGSISNGDDYKGNDSAEYV